MIVLMYPAGYLVIVLALGAGAAAEVKRPA